MPADAPDTVRAAVGRAALLVALGASLGLAANVARKDGVRLFGFQAAATCEAGEAVAAPSLISPAAAAAMCGRSDVVVFDARTPARFAEGHVAGAIHLPCGADGRAAADGIGHTTSARTVIVYGDSTAEAQPVAQALLRRDAHLDVRVLEGGFPAWAAAGQACASGPCDTCTETASTSTTSTTATTLTPPR
jgi:rhodanese-related sulfurtransferase